MIKYMLIVTLFILNSSISHAKFLVKIFLQENRQSYHMPIMYYIVDDLNDVFLKLSQIDSLTQRNILEGFGLPVVDYQLADYFKVSSGDNNLTMKSLFKKTYFQKNFMKHVSINAANLRLEITAVSYSFKYCTFNPHGRIWASYDADFDTVGILTTRPKRTKFTKNDIIAFERIAKLLSSHR